MGRVRRWDEIDRTQVALVGGKAAQLAELSRVDGLRVPAGFCVTTEAFTQVVHEAALDDLVGRLAGAAADELGPLAAQLRDALEHAAPPERLSAEIADALAALGEHDRYAVRSSATAEDLPTASFAGQHDSYLDVVGPRAIMQHVARCWASLYTDRAVAYRRRQGIEHARMAVLVQRMVSPLAAGTLFTADPLTSNREVSAVEAVRGVGRALVSGTVTGDTYRVRAGEIVEHPSTGGTPVLSDAQVLRLTALGRRIGTHLGCPQDIEWCLVDDVFQVVQSRPVTTLFPIPSADDGEPHVYVSVGHQQMMTDAMKPLGLSMWQLTTLRPMAEAGGRLFVDIAPMIATRTGLDHMTALGRSDPLIGDALATVVERGFVPARPEDEAAPVVVRAFSIGDEIETDPAIVTDLIRQCDESVATLEREIATRSGSDLFDFVLADLPELKRMLFDPRSHQAIMAGMHAGEWLNDTLNEWLGESGAADALGQSVAHNVTSEMGLDLLDVADVIRPYPQVIAVLRRVADEERGDLFAELPPHPGGAETVAAIRGFVDRYGARCTGEIDITRPRWGEQPATLVPTILANIANFAPGEAGRLFARGREHAAATRSEVLARLRALPDGERKTAEADRMIERLRTFAGYREYPKFGMVRRYFAYRQALLREADRLVRDGVLAARTDIFWLRLDELHEVVRTRVVDHDLLATREREFLTYQQLTPPRVMTSEGESVTGSYRREGMPPGALAGLAVSAGTVEGRARVVTDLAGADLVAGDILVTAFTDPSWTPLFPTIAALVTEVGGLMTHGAVVAREYGLPAVVGVERATELIADGQWIRVDGTAGWVEIVP